MCYVPAETPAQGAARQCLVLFLDPLLAKQRLVDSARLRIHRKQHQSRRAAIDPVQRRKGAAVDTAVAKAPNQARQQGFGDKSAGRRHRQKMRFVRDQQMFVDMQHGFLERNRTLGGDFAEIQDVLADPIRFARREDPSIGCQHPATRKAIPPLLAGDRRELCVQTLKQRRPRTGWQLQPARRDTIDRIDRFRTG